MVRDPGCARVDCAKDAARYRQQYEAAKDQVVMQVKTAYYSLTVLLSSIWHWTSMMKSTCYWITTRSLQKPGTSRAADCNRRW